MTIISGVSVAEYAVLSADVYREKSTLSQCKKFNCWRDCNAEIKYAPKFSSPFFARAYVKEVQDEAVAAVIAYRGTQWQHLDNDLDDLEIALFHDIPSSERLAKAFYSRVKAYLAPSLADSLRLTGHSLGGALAQLTAIKEHPHPEVVAFNAPGIGQLDGIDPDKPYPYIHNFNAKFGLINRVGKTIGQVTELDVPEGDWEAAFFGWLDIPSIIEQHSIDNLVKDILPEKKIADKVY